MDDYFSSSDGGVGDEFTAFAAVEPQPGAGSGEGLHQAIPPTHDRDITPLQPVDQQAFDEVPIDGGVASTSDYFASAGSDPFSNELIGSAPSASGMTTNADTANSGGAEAITEEPIQDVDIHAASHAAAPTAAAAMSSTPLSNSSPGVQSPAHAAASIPAVAGASAHVASTSSAAASSSVSSYFGGSPEADDAFGDIALTQTEATAAPIAVPADSANVASYFGGSDADDPLNLGGSLPPTEPVAVAQAPSASLDYFNQAAADDWMNSQPLQPARSQPPASANQFFDSFPQQQVPPAFPPQAQPHAPQSTFPPQMTAPIAARPDEQRSHATVGAPGGPPVSLSQSNTPAPHTAPVAAQQPAPSASTDDYFGGQCSGADDWLAVAAPSAGQASMHMPTSTQAVPPHQQQPYGTMNPYAPPAQPPQAHHHPAHPSAHLHPQHLQPPLPVDRQLSQLAEIDLNSPARPTHAVSDLADVPLTTPQAGSAANPYGQQTPSHPSPYGEAPRGHPPPSFKPMNGAPTMPGVMNSYASASAASSQANNIGTPAASPYGVHSGGAPFRPPMPSPVGTAAAMSEANGRAPPTPSTFQPRGDPVAVSSQPSPLQPQHATPWQPQQTQVAPHQNGHPAGLQQPYTPQHQQTPSYGQPPSATPQNAAFSAPGTLFSSPTSPLGVGNRPWAPPPAHPLVCFGFGGRLLTMLPRAGHDGAMRAGTIKLEPLTEMLDHTPFVAKLTSFPGPLTLPPGQPGTRHPRHVELEDMVQGHADQAMYDALPGDSPLAELVKREPQRQQEVLANHRAAKRMLHLLLLEALRHSGKIHRAYNPASPHTLPAAPAGQGSTVEESIVQYLVQLDGQGGGRKDGQWLDNAASSHAAGGDGVIPSPLKSAPSTASSSDASKNDDVVVAMQGLLMKGQRKEACNLAIEHQLWSHALLLASFDMATYHMVVGRFATQQFADGSPLQSLYLLFAQQPNLLFRGVAGPDGKGMDGVVIPGPHTPLFTEPNTPPLLRNWRANLSMLLANPTPNDKQVLTTLGDTLWQNYYLPAAAHMVYVLAGHSLGPDLPGSTIQHAQPLGRILLLGADHRKHMRTFVTPGALQRTEIFEYTRQLAATSAAAVAAGTATPSGQPATTPMLPYGGLSPAFQLFKLLYAYQLAEVGLLPRALQYCEQLSNMVALHGKTGKGSLVFPLVFLNGLSELESRLRECLSKKAGPGLASKIGGKLLGWLVGDSAQAPGATTVVGPDPTLATTNPIARSVSTNNIPQQRNIPQMMNSAQQPPLHSSSSELNLNQHHQQHHHSGAASADYNNFSPAPASASANSATSGASSAVKDLSVQPPPKHSRTRTEPSPDSSSSKSLDKSAEEATPGGTRKQSGLFGKITSLWGGGGTDGKKKPVKAHLRQENTFEYDDASGKWVQRDAKGNIVVDEEEEKPVAPPTISEEMKARLSAPPPMPTAVSPSGAGGSSTTGPSMPGMPPPSSMFAQRGAAGAKGRYALADNSFEDASASAGMPPAPVAAPMPGMFPLPSAGAPSAGGGFPAPMPGTVPAAGGAAQFKLFRPSVPAAPMLSMDGSPAPVSSPYGAPPQQQAQQQYGMAPMGRARTPPQARPDMPPQQQQPSQHPPSHPQQFAPPYGQPVGGYPQQHGMPSYDGRAQSTPPMRPGTVPAGGPTMPHMNPLGAPAAGANPMMMRYQPQMPGMPPQPQPGAQYNPAYRQPPPAHY